MEMGYLETSRNHSSQREIMYTHTGLRKAERERQKLVEEWEQQQSSTHAAAKLRRAAIVTKPARWWGAVLGGIVAQQPY
jgi:hypothetical protein